MTDKDDFYIGYEPTMPASLRRLVAPAVVAAVAIAVALAGVFVYSQARLANGRFEYGHVRQFEGYLATTPAPVLMIHGANGASPHWLVAPGKHGPAALIEAIDEGWVSLRGTLIERESWRMIEVQPHSIEPSPTRHVPPARAAVPEGTHVTLRGEIVDSKCYLGVMNPGERTVHRDCAVRCLSGGIPPMFAFQDDEGSHLALLLSEDTSLPAAAVGRQITLSGLLAGTDDALVFRVGAAR